MKAELNRLVEEGGCDIYTAYFSIGEHADAILLHSELKDMPEKINKILDAFDN